MSELRWALLLLAAGILAGVFLWTRYAPRLRARRRARRRMISRFWT